MFKSIRWKFIIVYFLLVFIAMLIVGVFMIQEFQEQQIDQITKDAKERIKNLLYSTAIQQDNWSLTKEDIQKTINSWPIGANESLYVIRNSDDFEIIASKHEEIIGQSAPENKTINPQVLITALEGEKAEGISKNIDEIGAKVKHLAYPVTNEVGNIKGIIYLTVDLRNVEATISEAKTIMTNATLLALLITVVLGFFLARSITGPINDVTIKAEKMAKGDFDQFVEVKSDDEIGQLASMFNYLTQKLKKTISEVHREKSKLDTIFTYMADGVIAVNMDGTILHANPVALDILKMSFEEINSRNYDDIIRTLNHKMTLNYLTQEDKWEGNETIELESAAYRAKYAPFKNERNEIGGLIVVLQDITEQHRLENMRKEFVANVSHELKTPITTIKSYTETLLDGVIDNKDLSSQFLTVINSECDRMSRIVRDLLQLSNLDYKQTKWKKGPVSIKKMLEEIFLKMEISAKEKKQSITLNVQEYIPNIIIDKDGIEQVILNIISNAIKYTQDSGKIDITAKTIEDKLIIEVKDNGIGIPEEDLDRIFERFYRVDKARSRELGGTGLGLSIAKQIIEAHNGSISISSNYEVGTEVSIILPISQL